MRTAVGFPERAELSLIGSNHRLVVENHANDVIVHAGRNDFSPREKSCAIRYLAAEGYIPDCYQWFADSDLEFQPDLKWLVEDPRAEGYPAGQLSPIRKILRVILCAVLVWAVVMALVLVHVQN